MIIFELYNARTSARDGELERDRPRTFEENVVTFASIHASPIIPKLPHDKRSLNKILSWLKKASKEEEA